MEEQDNFTETENIYQIALKYDPTNLTVQELLQRIQSKKEPNT